MATPVESWNVVWRYRQSKSLHWGKLPLIRGKRPKSIGLGGWPTWTDLTEKQLEEINKFPIKITEAPKDINEQIKNLKEYFNSLVENYNNILRKRHPVNRSGKSSLEMYL